MPDKQDILDSIRNRDYTHHEVRNLVSSVRTASNFTDKSEAKYLKIGDVFIKSNGKSRPFVIISIREKEGIVIAVPLTTTNDELALHPYTSRFFKDGWFTAQLVTVKISFARDNFAGVLDNRTAIRELKKELKKFYRKLL